MTNHTLFAVFGGGCFWCTEAVFKEIKGVISVISGYAGGRKKNPTNKEVCTGNTNHAEVVLIEFDPGKISYEKLVSFFFQIHDPTTLNRQGPDVGSQYRSAVFYFNENQKKIAEEIKKKINKNNVVTEILPASEFYKAEEYHQKYFEKMGIDGGCGIN